MATNHDTLPAVASFAFPHVRCGAALATFNNGVAPPPQRALSLALLLLQGTAHGIARQLQVDP